MKNVLDWKKIWKEYNTLYYNLTKDKPHSYDWTKQQKMIQEIVEKHLQNGKII